MWLDISQISPVDQLQKQLAVSLYSVWCLLSVRIWLFTQEGQVGFQFSFITKANFCNIYHFSFDPSLVFTYFSKAVMVGAVRRLQKLSQIVFQYLIRTLYWWKCHNSSYISTIYIVIFLTKMITLHSYDIECFLLSPPYIIIWSLPSSIILFFIYTKNSSITGHWDLQKISPQQGLGSRDRITSLHCTKT